MNHQKKTAVIFGGAWLFLGAINPASADELTYLGHIQTTAISATEQVGTIKLTLGESKPEVCAILGRITQFPDFFATPIVPMTLTHNIVCKASSLITHDTISTPPVVHVNRDGTVDPCRLDVIEENEIVSGTGRLNKFSGHGEAIGTIANAANPACPAPYSNVFDTKGELSRSR